MICYSQLVKRLEKPLSFPDGGFTNSISLPCGKCHSCRKNRVNAWQFRLTQELKRSDSAFFITLTYDTENIPILPSGNFTFDKKDLQNFFKLLRYYEKVNKETTMQDVKRSRCYGTVQRVLPIKYYAAAEYGDARGRSHYHIILYNATETCIQKAWQKGRIDILPVNVNTIDYTLKYINKAKEKVKPDQMKPFSMMSKNLGRNYLTKEMIDFHLEHPEQNYLVTERGYKIPMPKYYTDIIYKCKKPYVALEKTKKKHLDDREFLNYKRCQECYPCVQKRRLLQHIQREVKKMEEKEIIKAGGIENYEKLKQGKKIAKDYVNNRNSKRYVD